MKFIFADSQDFVDPGYDFEKDAYSKDRVLQRTDRYPHEMFKKKPYDGMLVSRAILADGVYKTAGAYSIMQSQRFKREGVSKFLRYSDGPIFGDSGAFSYVKLEKPPYDNEEMVEYYVQCGFTHAVAVDHIIFEYDKRFDDDNNDFVVNDEMRARYNITQDNAKEFIRISNEKNVSFEPIGVAQAWSPKSMQEASKSLVDMGYTYIAIGGLVPLDVEQCEEIVAAVRSAIPKEIKIHLFGFAKAKQLHRFLKYDIASFDSTSPLIRAFKDSKFNYYSPKEHYTAIRVPSSDGTAALKRKISSGILSQEYAQKMEKESLHAIRAYDKGTMPLEEALTKIISYEKLFKDKIQEERYRQVLQDQYWKTCTCEICKDVGVEVAIFRNSNRNRRRGFHNLWQFMRELDELLEGQNK
jgi:hypothetical protein